jgi:hypothetical protein
MPSYNAELDISSARLADLDDMLTCVNELATAELDMTGRKLRIQFDVGPGQTSADLWDLRDQIMELEERLSVYIDDPNIGKPVPDQ